ncbi:hypothetical protein GCM10023196_037450 [Actinoallomurus vinaceus]|uniref:DNA methylase adenine-specific domain-containing protein n=1 Tax=Actinoallomurus vinaceus TaxID=1080074 RepID=A0ABP8U9D2_9ACTN
MSPRRPRGAPENQLDLFAGEATPDPVRKTSTSALRNLLAGVSKALETAPQGAEPAASEAPAPVDPVPAAAEALEPEASDPQLDEQEPAERLAEPEAPAPAATRSATRPRRARAARRLNRLTTHRETCFKIAEAVDTAWHGHYGSGRIDIPIGCVAALTLIEEDDPDGPSLEAQILAKDGPELIRWYREVWGIQWVSQPYLVECARPIHDWLEELDENDDRNQQTVIAVKAVTKAALDKGLLEITGDPDPWWRSQDDLLGYVVTVMRSKSAREGLGQFLTPAAISEAMAALLLGDMVSQMLDDITKPGGWIDEPAAGTGGLIRAAAQHIRSKGHSPHGFTWSMTDLDPIAAACCAVNSIVWDLGPRVLVHCGDTLADPEGPRKEIERRKAVIGHRDNMLGEASGIAALLRAAHLLDVAVDAKRAAGDA